jgi:hypothetical protein
VRDATPHTRRGDVHIQERAPQRAVTEQHLHRAQVDALLEQLRGEAVAQRVRAHSIVAAHPVGFQISIAPASRGFSVVEVE